MTPENQSLVPHTGQDTLPVPATTEKQAERRKSRIARLPRANRDQINCMIDDGLPYSEIIQRLGLAAHDINEMTLSRWKDGGFRDWQRRNDIMEAIRTKYEFAHSIALRSSEGGNDAGQAVLQVMAANICEFLVETDPAELRASLLSDADKFTRFINSMVRLADGGIKCDLHKFHIEDRVAQAAKAKAPAQTPGISEESLRLAQEKLNLM